MHTKAVSLSWNNFINLLSEVNAFWSLDIWPQLTHLVILKAVQVCDNKVDWPHTGSQLSSLVTFLPMLQQLQLKYPQIKLMFELDHTFDEVFKRSLFGYPEEPLNYDESAEHVFYQVLDLLAAFECSGVVFNFVEGVGGDSAVAGLKLLKSKETWSKLDDKVLKHEDFARKVIRLSSKIILKTNHHISYHRTETVAATILLQPMITPDNNLEHIDADLCRIRALTYPVCVKHKIMLNIETTVLQLNVVDDQVVHMDTLGYGAAMGLMLSEPYERVQVRKGSYYQSREEDEVLLLDDEEQLELKMSMIERYQMNGFLLGDFGLDNYSCHIQGYQANTLNRHKSMFSICARFLYLDKTVARPPSQHRIYQAPNILQVKHNTEPATKSTDGAESPAQVSAR